MNWLTVERVTLRELKQRAIQSAIEHRPDRLWMHDFRCDPILSMPRIVRVQLLNYIKHNLLTPAYDVAIRPLTPWGLCVKLAFKRDVYRRIGQVYYELKADCDREAGLCEDLIRALSDGRIVRELSEREQAIISKLKHKSRVFDEYTRDPVSVLRRKFGQVRRQNPPKNHRRVTSDTLRKCN